MNWYNATHPDSLFTNNVLLERLTPTWRASLLNDRFLHQKHGEPPTARRIDTVNDFESVLDDVFDLESPVAIEELFDRIPKRLDGPCIPARCALNAL